MKHFVFFAALTLGACQTTDVATTSSQADPLMATLAGKKLTNVARPDDVVFLNANGSVSGVAEGAWTVRDGQYCRTLTKPAQLAGTDCQDVVVNGNQVTFNSSRGTSSTWTVESI